MKRFFQRNWFALMLAGAFAVAGTLPYLYGYTLESGGMRFMGFVGRGVFGHNGYLMLARQAQSGLHLMENLIAPEPLPRVFFNLEWWLFGKIARWSGFSLVGVFHISRVGAAFVFALSVTHLLRQCLATEFQRRFALALVMLGSGFGWIILAVSRAAIRVSPAAAALAHDETILEVVFKNVLMPLPPDVAGLSIPAYLVSQPHFIMAVAFASLTWAFLIQAARTGLLRYYVFSGFAALVHAAIRPYNVPEMYLLFALYPALLCLRDRRLDIRRFAGPAIAALIVAPQVLYYAWLAWTGALGGTGPAWTPGFLLHHVLWLGLPFVLSLVALPAMARLRRTDPALVLMGVWLVVAFLIEQSWRWFHGGQEAAFPAFTVAPVILATAGPLDWAYGWLRRRGGGKRVRNVAAAVLLILAAPSFLVAYRRMFTDLEARPVPYFISDDIEAGMSWLEHNAQKHDTVLAGFETGQLVPRLAGVKVFQGHYMITPNAPEKRALAERFYAARGDDEFKRGLVRDYGIRYVIVGPVEYRPGGMLPSEHPWLAEVFSQGEFRVYRVEESAR